METLSFTQDELKALFSILNSLTIKIGDAEILLPLAKKIRDKIKIDPKDPPPDTTNLMSQPIAN